MIHKVNRPIALKLDSGASQNGTLSYHGPGSSEPQPENEESLEQTPETGRSNQKPKLSLVASVEQVGMTEVVKNLLEDLQTEEPHSSPGLTLRYRTENALPKGLVVNRKAE